MKIIYDQLYHTLYQKSSVSKLNNCIPPICLNFLSIRSLHEYSSTFTNPKNLSLNFENLHTIRPYTKKGVQIPIHLFRFSYKKYDSGTANASAILIKFSKDIVLFPRSILFIESTDNSAFSVNSNCVKFLCFRYILTLSAIIYLKKFHNS